MLGVWTAILLLEVLMSCPVYVRSVAIARAESGVTWVSYECEWHKEEEEDKEVV